MNTKIKGIKFSKISIFLVILAAVFTVFVFICTLKTGREYETIVSIGRDNSECNKSIYAFLNSVNKLSTYTSHFIINNDVSQMALYFAELEQTKSRENNLEILELTHNNDYPDVSLRKAYDQSNKVCEYEIYNMRLVCDAINLPPDEMPSRVREVTLSAEDSLLSNEEKLKKAEDNFFSDEYMMQKDLIDFFANTALTYLVRGYISSQQTSAQNIHTNLFWQFLLIICLFFLSLLLNILLNSLILIPLLQNFEAIKKGFKMKVKGAYEIRYIANVYNFLCTKNEIVTSDLKHKAEHDPLTGLINRNGFNQIKEILQTSAEEIAYLLIDIDYFKTINDQYGHITGDKVLKKVADILTIQFRTTDYIARIGGDEFVVIMTKFGSTPETIIKRKIDEINNQLKNPSDDLPSISISVGVSFSDCGYQGNLLEKADAALYKVKKNGRSDCSFS